jgi:hypothetical protein|tara:strand:+ start:697 stop:900 length:204 start_codon:yes stop_codon:yes gene_type:complete
MSSLNNNLDKNGSKVEFYEDMYRSGVIKKGGSAYKRLQELRGTTEDERVTRLRKFLYKRQEDKKNGS